MRPMARLRGRPEGILGRERGPSECDVRRRDALACLPESTHAQNSKRSAPREPGSMRPSNKQFRTWGIDIGLFDRGTLRKDLRCRWRRPFTIFATFWPLAAIVQASSFQLAYRRCLNPSRVGKKPSHDRRVSKNGVFQSTC